MRYLYLLSAVTLALLSIAVLQRGLPSGSAQNRKQISISNKTQALQVTRAEVIGNQIHLSVRNGYQQNINWFRLALGKTTSIEADFAFTETGVLSPGQTYQDAYPLDPNSDLATITIVAVVFQDKTGEGDETYLKFIREKREGQKLGLKRLLPFLEKSSSSTDNSIESVLEALEKEATTEPAEDASVSEARRIGLRNVRERILNEVKRIRSDLRNNDRSKVMEDLRSVNTHYGRIAASID
jgi:hypothetical protein